MVAILRLMVASFQLYLNKEDATEIEVNDFISTVKSIKESTGISDEIDMDFNDNVGKVKMSMDDFFKQCIACGGNWGSYVTYRN